LAHAAAQVETTSRELLLPGLAPCTDYDFQLVPLVGSYTAEDDEETVEEVTTGPAVELLAGLVPEVSDVGETEVTVSWPVTQATGCVDHYSLSVCPAGTEEGCHTDTLHYSLEEGQAEGRATITLTTLAHSTLWRVEVAAVGREGVQWSLAPGPAFHTAVRVEELGLTAAPGEEGVVLLTWRPVGIATGYTLLTREADETDWREVDQAEGSVDRWEVIAPLCRPVRWALRLAVGEATYQVEAAYPEGASAITLSLDESAAFAGPVAVAATASSVSASWPAGPDSCIVGYRLSLCSNREACQEWEGEEAEHTFTDLRPCTDYTLALLPLLEGGRGWEAGRLEATARTELEVRGPLELHAGAWHSGRAEVGVSWPADGCATEYEVAVVEEGEEASLLRTVEPSVVLGPGTVRPCTHYTYTVTGLAGEAGARGPAAPGELVTGPEAALLEDTELQLDIGPRNLSMMLTLARETGCVEGARAALCLEEDCQETELQREETEKREVVLGLVLEGLLPGRQYTLGLTFQHDGEQLVGPQETLLTPLDLSGLELRAEAEGGQWVGLQWAAVEGAQWYTVYRRYQEEENETLIATDIVPSAVGGELEVADQRPCSTATYLVAAGRAGLEEQEAVPGAAVTLRPNDTEPYKAEGLDIQTEGSGARLEWEDLPCARDYTVTFTSPGQQAVREQVGGVQSRHLAT
jgi:hypothetical protein